MQDHPRYQELKKQMEEEEKLAEEEAAAAAANKEKKAGTEEEEEDELEEGEEEEEYDAEGNPIIKEEDLEEEEDLKEEEEGKKKTDFGLTKEQVSSMQRDYVERVLLNAPTTFFLTEQAKSKLIDLYTTEPKTWTIKKLSERFQISQGRVMGIIKLGLAEREIEHRFGQPLDDSIHNALYAFVSEQVSEAGHQFEGQPTFKRKERYKWTFEEPEMNEEMLQMMLVGRPKNRDVQEFREKLPEVPPPGVAVDPVVIVPPQIPKEKLQQRYLLNDRVQRVYVSNLTSRYRNDTNRHMYCIEPDGSVRTVSWEERRNILKKRYVIPKTYTQKIAEAFPGDLVAHAEEMRKARNQRAPGEEEEEEDITEEDAEDIPEEEDDELKL